MSIKTTEDKHTGCNHDWVGIHPIKIEKVIQNLIMEYPNQSEYIRHWIDSNLIRDTLYTFVCLVCKKIDDDQKEIYKKLIPLLKEQEKRRELANSIYENSKEKE